MRAVHLSPILSAILREEQNRHRPSEVERRTPEEHQRRKNAAEAKRKRRAEKQLKGTKTAQVIVDEMA